MREAIVASKYLGGLINEGRRRHGRDLESHVVHDEGVKAGYGSRGRGIVGLWSRVRSRRSSDSMVTQTKAQRCGGCGAVRRGAARSIGVREESAGSRATLKTHGFVRRRWSRWCGAAVLRCCAVVAAEGDEDGIEAGGRPKVRAKR